MFFVSLRRLTFSQARRDFNAISLDAAKKFVTVQAGVYMGHIQDFLIEHGLSLSWHAGNPAYTVGGCLATGCHNMGMTHVDDAVMIWVIR